MIQQNNMKIISKRLVDNVIKNVAEKLPLLSKAIDENGNSSLKIKSLHKTFFLNPSKIRRSERITKTRPYDR